RALIRDVAPGGGYILTSGNSLAGYLKPENVLAMVDAVQAYGRYPIQEAQTSTSGLNARSQINES
ncbi:MAG: hypothetical protein MUP90_04080, partial [Gammaproteobacteria bacterium]|nr:hypothetical protein [Gammaproteobacteria bacterium]